MVASPLFLLLLTLMFNEKNSPEILPYDFSLVHFFWEISSYQNHLINPPILRKQCIDFSLEIKKIEMDKINYILKAYHRFRIWKIEKEIETNQEGLILSRYTSEEKWYAELYKYLVHTCQSTSFSKFISVAQWENQMEKGELKTLSKKESGENFVVFFRVLKKKKFINQNLLLSEDPWNFYRDAVYCMKFKSVRRLIFSGVICLL